MRMKTYRDLVAWKKAMDLVQRVYQETRGFPKEEMYGLTAQIRRSAVSVPSNIAEGQGRHSDGAFAHYLSIAHGSLCELETQLLLAERMHYLEPPCTEALLTAAGEVGRLVIGLEHAVAPEQGR